MTQPPPDTQRPDSLVFLEEPRIARTMAEVEVSLGALRRLDLMGPSHRLVPEVLANFVMLSGDAVAIRDHLVAITAPIQPLVATDAVARRLADRTAGLVAQLDELILLVARLLDRAEAGYGGESGDRNRHS